jgi:hypothetical protein
MRERQGIVEVKYCLNMKEIAIVESVGVPVANCGSRDRQRNNSDTFLKQSLLQHVELTFSPSVHKSLRLLKVESRLSLISRS